MKYIVVRFNTTTGKNIDKEKVQKKYNAEKNFERVRFSNLIGLSEAKAITIFTSQPPPPPPPPHLGLTYFQL